jgi:26S proteasome regulatory subunit N5
MSDGQVLKAEKDFSKDVDKALPEAQEIAKVENSSQYLGFC